MAEKHLYPKDFTEVVELGGAMSLLLYAEGCVRWRHRCKSWDDDTEPDGVVIKVVAPTLAPAHVFERAGEGGPITIHPSLLCPDCAKHGHVVAGAWVPC